MQTPCILWRGRNLQQFPTFHVMIMTTVMTIMMVALNLSPLLALERAGEWKQIPVFPFIWESWHRTPRWSWMDPLSAHRQRNMIGCSCVWEDSKNSTFLSLYAKDWGRWVRTAMSVNHSELLRRGRCCKGISIFKDHSFASSFAHSDLQRECLMA